MPASIDIVIPVLNEERALPGTVATLREFLRDAIPNPCRIVIADNGSDDSTPQVGRGLAEEHPDVAYLRLEQRGRGLALRKAWLESEAEILAYMDVDLSTGLNAFPKLVSAIGEDGFDLAIGSRLMKGSVVKERTLKREITSRTYNIIIKAMFFTRFSDAQCGFKAISRRAAQFLIPKVKDQGWFFDSELLILAEKGGFRIKDVAVEWVDDPDSRVHVVRTARDDLKGLLRLRMGGLSSALRRGDP